LYLLTIQNVLMGGGGDRSNLIRRSNNDKILHFADKIMFSGPVSHPPPSDDPANSVRYYPGQMVGYRRYMI
jgi:hypothetical protein